MARVSNRKYPNRIIPAPHGDLVLAQGITIVAFVLCVSLPFLPTHFVAIMNFTGNDLEKCQRLGCLERFLCSLPREAVPAAFPCKLQVASAA